MVMKCMTQMYMRCPTDLCVPHIRQPHSVLVEEGLIGLPAIMQHLGARVSTQGSAAVRARGSSKGNQPLRRAKAMQPPVPFAVSGAFCNCPAPHLDHGAIPKHIAQRVHSVAAGGGGHGVQVKKEVARAARQACQADGPRAP